PRGSPPLDLDVSEHTVLVVTSYAVEDCIRLINRYAGRCRMVGFLVAFASPELRAHVRALPAGSYKGLYCLLPWKQTGGGPESAAFTARFRAKYRGPLARGLPDYHAAQAYASLLVAAGAVAEARRTGGSVTAALRRTEQPSPLGTVRFISYVDYYQQN